MASNLPGFLRRTLRISYDEDEDEDEQEVEEEAVEEEEEDHHPKSEEGLQQEDTSTSTTSDTSPSSSSIFHSNNNNYHESTLLTAVPTAPAANTSSEVVIMPKLLSGDEEGEDSPPSETNNWNETKRASSLLATTNNSEFSTGIESPSKSLSPRQQNPSSFSEPQASLHSDSERSSSRHQTSNNNEKEEQEPQQQEHPKSYREIQFDKVMSAGVVNMEELRKLAWNGVPPRHRPLAWKILLGHVPTNQSRRPASLQRKRAEYRDAIAQHYDIDDHARTAQEQETLRQVLVDVPRTAPEVPLFRNDRIRRMLARLLYIWAMRHPASSYVQGINDLATPLIVVFLAEYYDGDDVLDGYVMNILSDEQLQELESDVYGCLTNLLAGIQDHYTSDQPGVQRMVMRLEELVNRIDGDLCQHLREMGIEFIQFAFKWMNCLLLREFELPCVVRLWDTYISEPNDGFEGFHVYVCAAFLCQFSAQLQTMNFDDLFAFMQDIPTSDWGDTEIEMLLSQAYVLSTLFGGSDAHLISTNPRMSSSSSFSVS
ncbi:hypothetical protein ACA910_018728 [Epithemia clementina (nom. ined.)]